MTYIQSHETDLSESELREQAEHMAELLDVATRNARTDPTRLSNLTQIAIDYAGYCALLDPDSEAVCEGLQRAAEATAGVFTLAQSTEGEYRIRLGAGPPTTLRATGPTGGSSAGTWRKGFFAAVVCRETAVLDTLVTTPIEVIRDSSTVAQDCQYDFIEALQAFWQSSPQAYEPLRSALRATDPSLVDEGAVDYILHVTVPEINLLYQLMLGDRDGFDDGMLDALRAHRDYYSSLERKNDPAGFFALGLLGFASLADRYDIDLSANSAYLPRPLYEGKCQ